VSQENQPVEKSGLPWQVRWVLGAVGIAAVVALVVALFTDSRWFVALGWALVAGGLGATLSAGIGGGTTGRTTDYTVLYGGGDAWDEASGLGRDAENPSQLRKRQRSGGFGTDLWPVLGGLILIVIGGAILALT
jgi:hypothetical protein